MGHPHPAGPDNVVLVGMMGSGKTAVGRCLAQRLGREFVDLDAVIEREADASVAEIFATDGEAGFRARESAAVAAVAIRTGLVIACGGGAVLDPANVTALRRCGIVVWLRVSPEVAAQRLTTDAGRPVLGAMGGDLEERLATLTAQRVGAYKAAAHIALRAEGSVDSVTDSVLACLSAAKRVGTRS